MSIFEINQLLTFSIIALGITLGFAKVYFQNGITRSSNWLLFSLVPVTLLILAFVMFAAKPLDIDTFEVFALVGVTLFTMTLYRFKLTVLPITSNLEASCLLAILTVTLFFQFNFSLSIGFLIAVAIISLINLLKNKLPPIATYYLSLALNTVAAGLLVFTAIGGLGNIIVQNTILSFQQVATIFLVCLTFPIHGICLFHFFQSFRWKFEDSESYLKRMDYEGKFIETEKILKNQTGFRELIFTFGLIGFQLVIILALNINPIVSLAYCLTVVDFSLNLKPIQKFFDMDLKAPNKS